MTSANDDPGYVPGAGPEPNAGGRGGWSAELGGIRLTAGPGCLAGLGEAARELGGRRVLVVTDPGVRAAGHAEAARAALAAAGLGAALFDGVEENPTSRHVAAGAAAARGQGVDLLVGLGGGSALDVAKGINFVLTNGGTMADYWGFGKARRPMLPAIGVPTTAGTGSEAQSYALITDPESHRKMACGDPKARFRAVFLDPGLAATAPRAVAAAAGLDAISHAVESRVTRRRNPVSAMLAREAWRTLAASFEAALAAPRSAAAWGPMLFGAHLAGAAVETSMLGATHALANPLTARYGTVHGVAVGLMLPHVVRFNGSSEAEAGARGEETIDALYGELLEPGGEPAREHPADALAGRIEALRAAAGLPGRLRELGVDREALPELARLAAGEWTARFNPRPVAEPDLLALYQAAY